MKELVELLIKNNKTISTMESCTGGGVVNAITNIEGASNVLKFSAVTYSNEFKIKMGVDKNIIDKYTVYSMEIAHEMSKNIVLYTNSDYGIGITGQINKVDLENRTDDCDKIYISIYDKVNDKFYDRKIRAVNKNRKENKELIINEIKDLMISILR